MGLPPQLLWSIAGDDPAALRDRALIALGMALAARRSELVALDVADLAWEDKGLRVTIRRSKTDQEGVGAVVAVPEGRRLTPLLHLRAWLVFSGRPSHKAPLMWSLFVVGDLGINLHLPALSRCIKASGISITIFQCGDDGICVVTGATICQEANKMKSGFVPKRPIDLGDQATVG
jgi:hypothetical protein